MAPPGARIDRGAKELPEVIARRGAQKNLDPFSPDSSLGEGKSFGHLLGGLAGEESTRSR